jgi:RNA polymerase sigma factor for flagellar operon FliA
MEKWGEDELLLFKSHQWVVREALSHYPTQLHDYYDDLRSHALIGLWHAIESYDGNNNFISWAKMKVHYAIKDGLRELDYITRANRDHIKRMSAATNELAQKIGATPSFKMLREHGVDTDRAVKAAWFSNQEQPTSGEWLEKNTIPGADHDVIAHDVELRLSEHITQLPAHLSVVIELIYYGDYNQVEAGEILGMSGSRVSQLHKAAIASLRQTVTDEFL